MDDVQNKTNWSGACPNVVKIHKNSSLGISNIKEV